MMHNWTFRRREDTVPFLRTRGKHVERFLQILTHRVSGSFHHASWRQLLNQMATKTFDDLGGRTTPVLHQIFISKLAGTDG